MKNSRRNQAKAQQPPIDRLPAMSRYALKVARERVSNTPAKGQGRFTVQSPST